jgi:hypothetical protein
MKRYIFLAVFALAAAIAATAQTPPAIAIVRDPGCGCCLQWVQHLSKAGFKATVTESSNMDAVKDQRGVPKNTRSCHTGVVNGYVIEGHVPAADILRLLKERPNVAGLAVPGMPVGSPGMEVPGTKAQAYQVLAFEKNGKTSVFATH